nr:hypothetical protein [Tanacetum cinerariifolium]
MRIPAIVLQHQYRSTAYFTTLREILYMVDRHDLLMLYGLVVKYYANHPVAGDGLILWDVSYPFLVQLMERMLKHKLEIDKDVMGNDMTTAEQLIQFIKNQLATAKTLQVMDTGCRLVFCFCSTWSGGPLLQLMERMLKHKLEIDKDVMGNDMTTAEQLIQFIKNQLATAKVSLA